MDHARFLKSLPAETRAEMTRTEDTAGLRHLAGHVGLILALMIYVGLGLPLWWAAMLPLGVALTFLFTLQHECTHKTPFATGWINEAVGHITGLLIVQPFEWFRAFHMAHHRFTNDPDRDPELQEGAKPGTWPQYLWYLSTLGYWRAKLITLFTNAGGGDEAPYIPDRARARITREARVMIGVYGLALLFTLFVSPVLIRVWLVPILLGFPILRLYLLAEHGRCPAVADMFDNTRTTLTNRVTRYLAWNMPYHAEHHAWPTVPFHRLPELHTLTEPHLKRVSDGYVAFTGDYLGDLKT